MLSKQIEKAQKKVEEQNFLIRKRVLEYDDVMNEQRRIVYEYRDQVLEGRDMGGPARDEIANVVERTVNEYTPSDYIEDWDLDGMFTALQDIFPVRIDEAEVVERNADREELIRLLTEDAVALYDQREQELGEELMRALERYLILQIIDQRWREHLYDMDYLREGIHLRGFAQIDPLVAYKNEAFELFTDLMNTIWADFARMIFHVEVEVEGEDGRGGAPPAPPPSYSPPGSATGRGARVSYSSGAAAGAGAIAGAAGFDEGGGNGYEGELEEPVHVSQRRVDEHEQLGRNDPCWCGSGKKFKKCHGA